MTHPDMRLVPVDVSRLVIAARIVAYEDQSPEALKALDIAAEQFADRVPWEDGPDLAAAPHQPQPAELEEAPEGTGEAMTGAEVRQWIDACNHEPARQVLRDYLALRAQQPAQGEAVSGGTSGPSFQDVFLSWHEECGTVERAGPGATPIGKFEARWPSFHKRLWKAAMTSPDTLRDEWVKVAHECFRTASQQPADDKLAKAVEALEKAVWSLSSFGQLAADEEGGNTEGLDDEVIVRMTFPDPKFGGEKTLLGELFIRAFRKAKAATDECRQALAALKAEGK